MSVSFVIGLLSTLAVMTDFSATQGKEESKQGSPGSGIVVAVTGKVPKPITLNAESFAKLPRQSVLTKDRDGKETEYEGVSVMEVLKAAGLNLTPVELRGKALTYYLVVEASDGYRVVFALPELSPDYTDRSVLLADRRGGHSLDGKEGPLRIVVPGEKRQARWVRQVIKLTVARYED